MQGLRRGALYCSLLHKKAAASARHRERNPGYYKRYSQSPSRLLWREANRVRLAQESRAAMRQRREAEPETTAAYAQAWWAANPERHRLYQANRRALLSAHPHSVSITPRDWARLVARYSDRCAYCGRRPKRLHLDHVVPLKRGGRHGIGNAVPACQPCNSSKGARLLVEWRRDQQREGRPWPTPSRVMVVLSG